MIFSTALALLDHLPMPGPEADAVVNAILEGMSEMNDSERGLLLGKLASVEERGNLRPESTLVKGTLPEEIVPGVPDDAVFPKMQGLDYPEEPELVRVVESVADPVTGAVSTTVRGDLRVTPTGCDNPRRCSPYENKVVFRSALPKDDMQEANLLGFYQNQGWVDAAYCQDRVPGGVNKAEVRKGILQDVPLRQALKGLTPGSPDAFPSGVAGTQGMQTNATAQPAKAAGASKSGK